MKRGRGARRGVAVGWWRLAAALIIPVVPPRAGAATAEINAGMEHQVIRGFGGATVFQPPGLPASLTPAEIDTLFGNGPDQIGFTILRIRVAEDAAWREIELTHALAAKAHGAEVVATPWSPPAAMKSNNSLIDGFLLPSSYAAYATYLNDFATYMADHGASLYAISVQNEPDIDVDYESCEWTPEQMLAFCRDHAGAITATRLIAPESFQFRRNISDPILNDPMALENVEIIGGHIYGGGLVDYPLARGRDREVWMTEHLELTTDWAGALQTAREIHDCLAVANFNAYIWWYLRRYYGPLGEDGIITKRGHVMSQFTKFIRPGYVRVDATANPTSGIRVSAYKGEKLVIVAINQGTSAVDQVFTLQDANVTSLERWETSGTLNLEARPAVAVAGGAFTVSLPAGSITTLAGDLIFAAPVIVVPPRSHAVAAGSALLLSVEADGEFLAYQWKKDGQPIPGATSRLFSVSAAQAADAGTYAATVSTSGGSVTSPVADVAVVETNSPGRLVNLSARSFVGTGSNVQIGGFVIAGNGSQDVLARAAGPELELSYSLPGVLADPVLELHSSGGGATLEQNNDWDPALAPVFAAVSAFSWTEGSSDAALRVTLPAGVYTAVVQGSDGGTGVALIELYAVADAGAGSRLVNLSARAHVGTNDDVLIGGFAIAGTTAKAVVLRAAGPALNASHGLNGVLADPQLELYNQDTGEVIATAEDWDDALAPHFASVGAFPWMSGSRDAAIVTTLDPGAYTVIVRGAADGTGVALVEIYEL